MENAERADHRAVAGHRVVNAGEDHHAAVQGVEDRKDHRRRNQDAAVGAEERLGRGRAEVEGFVLGDFVGQGACGGQPAARYYI